MKYSKFKTTSGIEFYYDNVDNKLHELDGSRIQLTPDQDWSEYSNFAVDTYNSRKKHNKPVALRILMGHACNYSCTYCMQKDIGNPNELPKRDGLERFFQNIKDNLDLSNLKRVELWGGEPFLYWNDMQEIMKFFENENVTFVISTNGSALSPKHAEFFRTIKCYMINMNLSHDAEKQQQLRGDEIFNRPRVIETLRMFDEIPHIVYGFSCSVTNTNFDLFEINDFFRNKIIENGLKSRSLQFSLGRTYQESASYNPANALGCNIIDNEVPTDGPKSESFTHVIHGENLDKFRMILSEFLSQHYKQYIESFVDGAPTIYEKPIEELPLLLCDLMEEQVAYSALEFARKLIQGEPILEKTNCGADMQDVISLDIDGMIRTCPHTDKDHIYGSLNNIKGIRILSLSLNDKQSHCGNCPNKLLCRSSCPIKLPDETFYTNCRVEKIWYGEIQKASFRILFNEDVELIEYGLHEMAATVTE
jgi:radical SAM protein with 4Fe4S-binding SPASM domain